MSQQSIGDYTIIRDLGGGGMARVFLGVHKDVPNLRVVLKLMRDPRMADRFSQEADKLALLERDRHVCQLKHFFKHEGDMVIAMEHIEGPTLEERLSDTGVLSVTEAAEIVGIVLDVLSKAHAQNIWHRDIKPSNIMLEHGLAKAVKVIDFGIAKAESDPALTAAGSCCGTPLYMAPEQFVPDEHTNFTLADIYAVGVTLYNLLTGELPHKGDNEFAIRDAKLNEDPVPPRKHNSSIPAEVEAVILKAIARNPEDRYQSAQEMKQALLLAAGVADLSQTQSTEQTANDRPKAPVVGPGLEHESWWSRLSGRTKGIGIGALVVVAALVIWFVTRSGEVAPPEAPVAHEPADGVEVTDVTGASFVWGAVEGDGITYLLQYDDNPEFMSPDGVSNLTDTARPLDTTMAAGRHYWRVRAISRGIIGPYSEVSSFVVAGPVQPAVATGRLLVSTNMPSDITIDGELVRKDAGSLDTTLEIGSYRVQASNRSSAERRRSQTVTIAEGETSEQTFSFTPKVDSTMLRVTSRPAFADIYIDGELQEAFQTPQQFELPVGRHVIRVSKDGQSVERTIELRDPSTYKFFIAEDSVSRTD